MSASDSHNRALRGMPKYAVMVFLLLPFTSLWALLYASTGYIPDPKEHCENAGMLALTLILVIVPFGFLIKSMTNREAEAIPWLTRTTVILSGVAIILQPVCAASSILASSTNNTDFLLTSFVALLILSGMLGFRLTSIGSSVKALVAGSDQVSLDARRLRTVEDHLHGSLECASDQSEHKRLELGKRSPSQFERMESSPQYAPRDYLQENVVFRNINMLYLNSAVPCMEKVEGSCRKLHVAAHDFVARLLEPTMRPSTVRIRYKCSCGQRLWEDYPKVLEPQALELAQTLHRHFRRVEGRAGGDQKIDGPCQVIGRVISDLKYFSNATKRWLSQGGRSLRVDGESHEPSNVPATIMNGSYYLTSFPSSGDLLPRLVQAAAAEMQGDRGYFAMLRAQARMNQRPWIRFLVPRRIKAIQYVKVSTSTLIQCARADLTDTSDASVA